MRTLKWMNAVNPFHYMFSVFFSFFLSISKIGIYPLPYLVQISIIWCYIFCLVVILFNSLFSNWMFFPFQCRQKNEHNQHKHTLFPGTRFHNKTHTHTHARRHTHFIFPFYDMCVFSNALPIALFVQWRRSSSLGCAAHFYSCRCCWCFH